MQQKTLMLITDISGYTRFITRSGHTAGIGHARELLRIIINANTLGLKLCEVEGDAVFFYTTKRMPSATAVLKQINRTYRAFNHYLATHGLESELGIKFFLHAGACEEIRIGGRLKLFGTDVIKIHRLLKCIPDRSDYLLVTEKAHHLLQMPDAGSTPGESTFPHLGSVRYAIFDHQFIAQRPFERDMGAQFKRTLGEAAEYVTRELGRHYRWYSTLVHEMAGIA